ncbi:MAG: OmpH family outer membrane protein [Deltaproteobacteria bacterium]|nr:OmpH family outer membrane protein [Deltaproteobacteria bacterium]
MKKVYALVFMVLISSFATAAESNLQIAVFDAQQVLDNVEQGKAASKRMEELQLAKKSEFDQKKKDLEKMKQDLDAQALVLSKDAFAKKEREFQEAYIKLQQEAAIAERDLQKKEIEETGVIFKNINAVIQKIGKDKNYDFILEKNQGAVTYFKSGDITDKVIELYNKTYKATKDTKKK